MRAESRHILLTVDNFSAHSIDYEPTNIQLEFFEPNLTSFVQPLDAGIIRCYKAQYRKAVCMRALELDAAGERDIYKINVLEGIKMSEAAWNAITTETIQHCWNHTKIIQPFVYQIKLLWHTLTFNFRSTVEQSQEDVAPHSDAGAWDILRQFAGSTTITLPEAEEKLKNYLGTRFKDKDWQPTLKAIMDAEADVLKAQAAIKTLSTKYLLPRLTIKIPARPPQVDSTEKELMDAVNTLRKRNRIFGVLPTIDQLVEPDYELEVDEDSPYAFPGGLPEIIAQVQHEEQVKKGEIIEIDTDSDDDKEDRDAGVTHSDTIHLTEQMERLVIKFGNGQPSLDLARKLREFRGALRREELLTVKQTQIKDFFTSHSKHQQTLVRL